MNKDNSGMWLLASATLFAIAFMGGAIAFGWYRAGIQADVYNRQGAHMTRWEVFIGAKPIVRNMVVDQ